MRLLFPELTLMQALALLAAFVVCLVFGGEPSPGIVYALPPLVVGLLAAGAVAASAAPKIIEGVQKKRALKRIEESPEAEAVDLLQKKARKRLEKGDYGLSETEKRQMVGEAARSYEAGTKSLESEVKRAGAASPLGGGAARTNIEAIREGTEGTTAKARAAGETISQQKAATETAADVGTTMGGLAHRTSMETGRAAAATDVGAGVSQLVGGGLGAGTQLYAAGAFNPNLAAQAAQVKVPQPPPPVTGAQVVTVAPTA